MWGLLTRERAGGVLQRVVGGESRGRNSVGRVIPGRGTPAPRLTTPPSPGPDAASINSSRATRDTWCPWRRATRWHLLWPSTPSHEVRPASSSQEPVGSGVPLPPASSRTAAPHPGPHHRKNHIETHPPTPPGTWLSWPNLTRVGPSAWSSPTCRGECTHPLGLLQAAETAHYSQCR